MDHVTPPPKTLGQLIDDLSTIRERRRVLAAKDKLLETQYKIVEAQVQAQLVESEMPSASGRTAVASISYTTVGAIVNYEEALSFMKRAGYLHLLGRSLSAPAFREVYELELAKLSRKRGFDSGKLDPAAVLPGMRPFTVTRLNLSALKVPRKVA